MIAFIFVSQKNTFLDWMRIIIFVLQKKSNDSSHDCIYFEESTDSTVVYNHFVSQKKSAIDQLGAGLFFCVTKKS